MGRTINEDMQTTGERLKFPDKPIATAGLGVVCALVLLAVLSWPTLVGSTTSQNLNAGASSTVANTSTVTYAALPSATIQTRSSQSVSETANEVSVVTASKAGTGNSSNGAFSVSISSSSSVASTVAETTLATSITSSSLTIQAGTTVESSATQPDLISSLSVSESSSNHYSIFSTLVVLSIVSLAIALSSMFFVRRSVNSEEIAEIQKA
ncbi:MAG: hypothetical protein ABSE82_02100 [Nitrososphaerales archaeon]|jgi:hypothetical protein